MENIIEKIFKKILKFYLNIFVFLINKYALLRKKWQLREIIKKAKKYGVKVTIKNNQYIGGTEISVEVPIQNDKTDIKK